MLNEDGFLVLKGFFDTTLLTQCRDEVLQYIRKYPQIQNADGITIPDFIQKPYLSFTSSLKDSNELLHTLQNLVFQDSNFRFCSHNDIGINRIVGWHKDKLNGPYSKFERNPIWSSANGETHEIYKVLIFLNNQNEFRLVRGSHLQEKIDASNSIPIHTELGDVLIFDQRITHRGAEKHYSSGDRILVSFGFGKNNCFTDNFEQGTIQRQNDQNRK